MASSSIVKAQTEANARHEGIVEDRTEYTWQTQAATQYSQVKFDPFSTSSAASKTASVGLSFGARVWTALTEWVPGPLNLATMQVVTPQEIEATCSAEESQRRKVLLKQLDAKAAEYAASRHDTALAMSTIPMELTARDYRLIGPELFSHACKRGCIYIMEEGRQTRIFTGGTGPQAERKRRKIAKGVPLASKRADIFGSVLFLRPRSEDERQVMLSRAQEYNYTLQVIILSAQPAKPAEAGTVVDKSQGRP